MELLNETHDTIHRSTVDEKINHGYTFDIGEYFSQGWEIFRKEWLTFSIYSLLLFIIITLAAFTIIGLLFVVYPLYIGYFIGADKVKKGESLSVGDMFGGFKHNLGQLAILTLVPVIVMGVAMIPFFGTFATMASMAENSDVAGGIATGSLFLMYPILFILGIILNLVLFFAPYLVFFGNYSAMEALKTSWKLSMKQPLWVILYGLLIGFVAQIGTMLCGIGVFTSFGFAYVCYYPVMKDILFNEKVDLKNNPLV